MNVPFRKRERNTIMSLMKRTVSAGLIAVSIAGALAATAPAAEARDRHRHHRGDDVLLGAAAGVVGGLIGGAIVSGSQRPVYVEPEYDDAPPPPPQVVYRRAYYEPAPPPPRCHFEWVENEWGEAYRARVCY
jgi:hypothetical protein